MKHPRLILSTLLIATFLLAIALVPSSGMVSAETDAPVTLTLLHNSDGESALLSTINTVPAGSVYGNTDDISLMVGGVASFKTLMDEQIAEATTQGNAVVAVYAGDAFLASSTIVCSLPPLNQPIYDAVAQRQMPYTAHIIGNHEFDFNPDFLEQFIRTFDSGSGLTQPFLSANLDFSAEPGFADLIDTDGLIEQAPIDDRPIAYSMIYTDPATNEAFGIVGATTPLLETISSPRDVVVADLAETIVLVQAEIDRLKAEGVNKIIFTSHLQDLDNDIALIGELSDVDIAVGGGGDEMLVNPDIPEEDQLLPGEVSTVFGDYPYEVTDKDGKTVYLVTTKGNYKYLGRLDINFDTNGDVTSIDLTDSYPRRNIPDTTENAVAIADLSLTDVTSEDAAILTSVIDPLKACVDGFETDILAYSEVVLDVSRDSVRGVEANGGNLISDAFLYAYQELGEQSGVTALDNPTVAIQNGGGIRQNAGDFLTDEISRKNTLDVLPFANDVVVLEDVSPDLLKEVMEFSVTTTPPWGGFLQIGGMMVTYDLAQDVGNRVVGLKLEDGTTIVEDGAVVAGAPDVNLVTNNFTAGGGDGYTMLSAFPTIALADTAKISYERALVIYLTESTTDFPIGTNGLPTIQASDVRYQEGGEGRINFIYRIYWPAIFTP
jgi:2',3'-cyclic-nucleotide 2'-phosphodiesterase / 3'-nucleotidase / 5'-nucleotidase